MHYRVTLWLLKGPEDKVDNKIEAMLETEVQARTLHQILLTAQLGHFRLWTESLQEDRILRYSEVTFKETKF